MNRSLLALLALALPVAAQAVPFHLTNQGRLVDDESGLGLQGVHDLTFSLYTDAAATEPALWAETVSVDLVDGTYSVVLGLESPLDDALLDQHPLYLGLSVDGDEEMLPRYEVSSVPYAIQADSAVVADHAASADSASTAVTATNVAGGTVDASALSVDGQAVIDEDGAWVGEAPAPPDLGCADGELQAWNDAAEAWECAALPTTVAVLDCADGEHPFYDGEADLWTCAAEADPLFTASPAVDITAADLLGFTAAANDFAEHGSHAEAGYLTSYTETDPHFADAPASAISDEQIAGWDNASDDFAEHGSHTAAGYLTSYTETDPVYGNAPASGISDAQIAGWDNASDDFAQHGSHTAAGYLTSTIGQDISIDGDITVSGNITVGGDIQADANSRGSCAWTGCVDAPTAGFCPSGKYVAGLELPEFHGDQDACGNRDDWRIYCCEL